jgi:subtilisin family serine protease
MDPPSGAKVAIIDSGVDPGHADLQMTSEGLYKILDFIDLTTQGSINLKETAKNESDLITIDERSIDVSSLPNNADEYRYGY